jgi:hypothetical protein
MQSFVVLRVFAHIKQNPLQGRNILSLFPLPDHVPHRPAHHLARYPAHSDRLSLTKEPLVASFSLLPPSLPDGLLPMLPVKV